MKRKSTEITFVFWR